MSIFELVTIIRSEQKPLYRLKVGDKFGFTIPNDFTCQIVDPIIHRGRITYRDLLTPNWSKTACDETILVWVPK